MRPEPWPGVWSDAVGKFAEVDIAVCPPYTNSGLAVGEIIKGSTIRFAAFDVHWEAKGAYTGKVSTAMLKSVGVDYVIIGHSEQRTYFNETDETVNKKVKATLAAGLLPIICVGETLDERRKGLLQHRYRASGQRAPTAASAKPTP